MAALSGRRVTVLAVLLFVLVSLPNLSSSVSARPNRPIAVYAPGPNMPLPAPTLGIVARPAPVSGVLRILVIAAAFANINASVSINDLKTQYFQKVAAYYQEVSYGKVTITGDVFGWYKLPYAESHYGGDCNGSIDDASCTGSDSSWQVAQDAVVAARKDNINYMNYDYYVFVHSGSGQETSGVANDVWSVTFLGGVYVQTSSKTLEKFNVVPELESGGAVPTGVYCHEFGHQLGLPDLYNTQTGKTILGPWSLMDKGLWNGNPPGSSSSHMEAWSKIQLGFISGSMLATANPGVTSTFTIDPTEVKSGNVHAVEVPLGSSTNPSQYYLIEVRAFIGSDVALPATGVLIMYVDYNVPVGGIRVMDGHPSVPLLNGATWNVGQTFTDSKDNFAVTVGSKIGDSFQVTVNRGSGVQPPPPPQNQTYIDLAVTGVSVQPQVITLPNTTVTITAQISELGAQPVTNVPVEIDLDGQFYANTQVSLGAGSSTSTSFTWTSVVGSHVFRITVDPQQTVNDTNRANNVATFTVNVGPTLTINIPFNVTSGQSIWVLINGVKYNVTSSQLQASVPTGIVTVQIQPAVNTSVGVRQLFHGWSDGNFTNPRQITVTSSAILQAVYSTQFLLMIQQNGGTTTPSAWYNPNSTASVYAANPTNLIPNAARLLFSGWSGDINSNSTQLTVNMTKPVSLQANWIHQYYVTIISPTGSPTGAGWYNAGTIATVAIQSTVQFSNGTRRVFTGWNSTSLGKNPTTQIMVNSPTILQASWKTQYLVNVQSQYGAPVGSGWYDAGSSVVVYVQPEVDYANATRRTFSGWTGDYAGASNNATLQANQPMNLAANWNTEYLLTFRVNGVPNSTILKLGLDNAYYNLSVNHNYQAWYQRGSTIDPVLNQTVANGIFVYKFAAWRNATGAAVQGPMTVNSPGTYLASYNTELVFPPIPGFPIEGIIMGIVLGTLVLALIRRRRQTKR